MPEVIQFKNGNQIRNLYDASGTKLRSMTLTYPYPIEIPVTGTISEADFQAANGGWLQATGYIKNREYILMNWGEALGWGQDNSLVKTYNPEGYKAGRGMHYYRRDHLGSIREVWRAAYTVGSTTYPDTTLQRTQYYPSGLPWNESYNANLQQRKYNGKEWIEAHGYDMYDYGARGYYPASMRFTTIDPLAEKKPWLTPYHYCSNNPINFIDPDGRREWPVNSTYNGYGRRHENNFGAPRPNGRTHKGVDINHTGRENTDKGAPIFATHDGTITRVVTIADGDKDSGGNRVQITSSDGSVSTYYMHLDAISEGIKTGSIVAEGQQIGTMGGSGKGRTDAYTSHLHYEIKIDGVKVNPATSATNLLDPQQIITPFDCGILPEITVIAPKPIQPIPVPEINPLPTQLPDKLNI